MDTQVLTSSGWRDFDTLGERDLVATVSTNGSLEYLPHYDKFKKYSDEGLVTINNWNFDIAVTPEHRILARKQHLDNFSWVTAKNLDTGKYTKIYLPVSPKHSGFCPSTISRDFLHLSKPHPRQTVFNDDIPFENLLALMGWYISEGSRSHHSTRLNKNGDRYGSTQISITQKTNHEYVQEIKNLVSSFGSAVSYTAGGDIVFSHADLWNVFGQCGDGFYNKTIPRWVYSLDPVLMLKLAESLIKGDGSRDIDAGCYYTSSPQLADDFQELLFLCGYRTSVYMRPVGRGGSIDGRKVTSKHPQYCINFTKNHSGSIVPSKHVKVNSFSGNVWCVSNDNGTLVTRRGGKVAIIGNCGEPAPRKGGQMAFDAFRNVFGDDEDITLTIKANQGSNIRYDPKTAGVLRQPQYFSNVELITKNLPESELVALFHNHDVLLYPSWGEGFGFIPLQALATGMPVIFNSSWAPYKKYSMGLDIDDRLVPSPWTTMHPGKMLEPSQASLESLMVEVSENYGYYSQRAFQQADHLHREYDWDRQTYKAFQPLIERFSKD